MVSAVRALSVAATLLLAAFTPSRAYKVRAGEVYEVPEAARVSAKQLFARDVDIVSMGKPYIKLVVTLPGRMYIRHVENATAVAAGVFGKLRVSGDTRGAVEFVEFPKPGESATDDERDELSITYSFETTRADHKTESLLLEVELYEKSSLKAFTTYGSADVVILEDVLFESPPGKTMADVTSIRTGVLVNDMSPGKLFVSDPKGQFQSSTFSISSEATSTVQVDFASLNSTQTELWVLAQATSKVAVFASEYVSPIQMQIDVGEGVSTNPLCVATKDDVKLSTTLNQDWDHPTNTTIPGGSSCRKLALPPREPSLIGDETSGPSADVEQATPVSFSPLASASPATTTAAPTSSASSLVWTPVLVVLLPLVLGWQC